MKNILSASQIRAADEHTISSEPIASIDLMERAAICFVKKFEEICSNSCPVTILVGPGNNGGDGLVIGRLLKKDGFTVRLIMHQGAQLSPDAQVNLERIDSTIEFIEEDITFAHDEVIIDALFGTGLRRPIEGLYAMLIKRVNQSKSLVVSVDIPSGLFADDIAEFESIIRADDTITFQRPKLSFLLPESGQYCGVIHTVDIGLDESFISLQNSAFFLVDKGDVSLKPRSKFDHKGVFGHAQVFAGSKGKLGAAVLSTRAALIAGAGLVTAHVPARGESVVHTAVPEAMVDIDAAEDFISGGAILSKVNALCIGPGIGQHADTIHWFDQFLKTTKLPIVLDADAINILARHQDLLLFLSRRAILTPHLGELERLIGKSANGKERLEKAIDFATKYQVVLLIKGAYSATVTPEGKVFFNPTGNPGMATAGSGDVLAGLITGLIAQGYSLDEATTRAVYYHGLAGDLAVLEKGEHGFVASDLLQFLPKAYSNVQLA